MDSFVPYKNDNSVSLIQWDVCTCRFTFLQPPIPPVSASSCNRYLVQQSSTCMHNLLTEWIKKAGVMLVIWGGAYKERGVFVKYSSRRSKLLHFHMKLSFCDWNWAGNLWVLIPPKMYRLPECHWGSLRLTPHWQRYQGRCLYMCMYCKYSYCMSFCKCFNFLLKWLMINHYHVLCFFVMYVYASLYTLLNESLTWSLPNVVLQQLTEGRAVIVCQYSLLLCPWLNMVHSHFNPQKRTTAVLKTSHSAYHFM